MQITPTSIRIDRELSKRLKLTAKNTGFKEADLIRAAISHVCAKDASEVIALVIDTRSQRQGRPAKRTTVASV